MVREFPELTQEPAPVLVTSRGEAVLGPLYRLNLSQQPSRLTNVVVKIMRSVGVGLVMVTWQVQPLP